MLSVDSITSPHHCLNLKGCKLVAFHSLKSFFASLTKNPMVFICVPCVPSTIPVVHHPALPEHSNTIDYKAYNHYTIMGNSPFIFVHPVVDPSKKVWILENSLIFFYGNPIVPVDQSEVKP